MALQDMLAKVAKLRALAARAGTQAEAETAAAQANAIIERYRLSEVDLEAVSDAPTETAVKADEPLDSDVRPAWLGVLANGLAKHYGCFVYREHETSTYDTSVGHTVNKPSAFPVFGRASDIGILRYMYAWLKVEITRLSEFEKGRANRNAFRLGAVRGFLTALRDSTQQAVAQHNTHAGLVLISRSKEAETLARADTHLSGRGRVHSRGDAQAYNRGQEAGSRLHSSQKAIGPGSGRYLKGG